MNVDQNLRSLRIVHLMMLVAIPFYALAGERITRGELNDPLFLKVFAVVAGTMALTGFIVRGKLVGGAADQLRTRSADSEGLMRWRAGNIVSFVLAEGVALLGLALRAMGANLTDAGYFYGAGILLMLIWTPRRPG